ARIRLDPAAGGRRVRRLGVVHEADAVDLGNELEAVLDSGKRAQRFADRIVLDPGGSRGGRRGGGVLPVVRTGNQRLGRQHVTRIELDTLGPAWDRTEVARHDGDVRLGLILEDAQLRVAVCLVGAVT